jgi:transposase-like protein
VLDGLRGEESISELCRREGIAASIYYGWSKEFLEAGRRRLAGDTTRAATSGEVKDFRRGAPTGRSYDRLGSQFGLRPRSWNCLAQIGSGSRKRSMLIPRGRRPSTAAFTSGGARKASESVMLI